MAGELPSGTVTLLFTDIEGSTKRWESLPQAMAVALARHDALLRGAIEEHDGGVFKTIGDAFCAAFADPGGALRAALAAQRALAAEPWGETGPVRVRMALHTGTPEHRDRDYFGPPVNRVARILSAGYGGQVLVSHATAQALGERLPAETRLDDLGSHRLKDLLQPERLYQIVAPDLAGDFPPIKTLDRQPHNLPAQPTPLVGREDDVARVREVVEGEHARLVTLTGPGGTGKTRLALQAAAELVDTFPDGAWFVALAPLRDPALVAAAIAQPLGVREAGHEPIEASLLGYLRDKKLLLVLDNMEHVLPAAPVVGRLLAACPGVVVLATSRAALRVYGERETPIPPLPLPDPKRLPPLAELAEIPAVELFVERAQAVRPGFDLTAENMAAVAGICVRLEGLPLAIELAAARVRVLAPDRLLERLAGRLDLLTGGASDRDERQRTLRGAIAWSHDLLPPDQQTLFRRLSVFAGGATFDEAEAVAAPNGELDALDGLEALVTQSLLRQEDGSTGELRFAMLETIREYAAERLAESGEAEAIRARHAARFLSFAETAEPHLTGAAQAEWLDRLDTDHDNLRAALALLGDSGDPEEELRLAAALWRFWDIRGHLTEGRRWLDDALARTDGGPETIRARALEGAGVIAIVQGNLDHASSMHEEALFLSRVAQDEAGMGRSTGYLGWIAGYQGDFEKAARHHNESLSHFRAVDDRRGVAATLHALSEVALSQGNYAEAQGLGAESLSRWRTMGDASAVGRLVHHLGRISFLMADTAAAISFFEQSLSDSRSLGNTRSIVDALTMLGRANTIAGQLDEGLSFFEEALAIARDSGDKGSVAFAIYGVAYIDHERGNADRAFDLFGESLLLYQEIGDAVGLSECLEGLAEVQCLRGSVVEGVLLLGAAETLRDSMGIPLPPILSEGHERAIASARQSLDEASFDEIMTLGRAMSADQAVTEVTLASS